MADQPPNARRRGVTPAPLPLILVVTAVFLLMLFQTVQAFRDRSTLENLRSAQEPTVQEAVKVRQQLDSLAGKTAVLAAGGDAGAKAVVDDMKRQGVTLTPPKQP